MMLSNKLLVPIVPKRICISRCFYMLGISREEAYPKGGLKNQLCNAELRGWLDFVHREAIVKYHPDKHPGQEEKYTELSTMYNQVYQWGVRHLEYKSIMRKVGRVTLERRALAERNKRIRYNRNESVINFCEMLNWERGYNVLTAEVFELNTATVSRITKEARDGK